jgi:peptidoglycan/xylan/chitin deacetylase (PgdA/CDA1 family)
VLSILEKYGFHGTFFVATDAIGKHIDNSEHKPQTVMDAESLRQLEESPCANVEPHSCSHKEFTSLSVPNIEREVRESRAHLEALLGKTCDLFAYPRGVHDATSERILKDAKFLAGVTVREGVVHTRSMLYTLPRNTVHGDADMAEFKGKLTYASSIINAFRKTFT